MVRTVHAGARPAGTSLDVDIEDQDGDARLEEDSGSDTDTDIPPLLAEHPVFCFPSRPNRSPPTAAPTAGAD
jgi:hypothetical protein